MRITVIGGTGYVGLTVSVCLASQGHTVYSVDIREDRIQQLQAGIPTIREKSLKEMLNDTLSKGVFIPSTDVKGAIKNSEIVFLCVGTPSQDDGSIDLSQIKKASLDIGLALKKGNGYKVVVVKSTVIPGSTENLVIPTLEKHSQKRAGADFGVCMNPEFLREGRAIKDFQSPKETGIVIGELDKKSGDLLYDIYKEFDAEILRTSIRVAETVKYARNAYLAKDISFANEMANVCQGLGIDYLEVKKGMEMDSRIGSGRFLNAGAGFGGSCFPKDVRALMTKSVEVGVDPKMLRATLAVNEIQPYRLVEMTKWAAGTIAGKRIAVLGLSFKPGTDDMREAPSIKVVNSLLGDGAEVIAYDPEALETAKKIFGDRIIYAKSCIEALDGADACVIVTEWPEFKDPKLYRHMRGNVVVDGRRILNPGAFDSDFRYIGVGWRF